MKESAEKQDIWQSNSFLRSLCGQTFCNFTLFITSLGKAALFLSFLSLICVFSADFQKRDLGTDLLSNAGAKGSEVCGDRPDCPLNSFSLFSCLIVTLHVCSQFLSPDSVVLEELCCK